MRKQIFTQPVLLLIAPMCLGIESIVKTVLSIPYWTVTKRNIFKKTMLTEKVLIDNFS